MTEKKPFKKHMPDILVEQAHGGSGRRQVLLGPDDGGISKNIEAVTKGFLASGGVFDWHDHDRVDEFFIVTQGRGYIEYETGKRYDYKAGDLIYSPANIKHRIENTGADENHFLFIRVNA